MPELKFHLTALDHVSGTLDRINRKATETGENMKRKLSRATEAPRETARATAPGAGPLGGVLGGGGAGGGIMGAMGGASGGLMGMFAITELAKTGIGLLKKITSVLTEASPLLGGTLKLIYKSLLLWLRPIGDMLATILMPIAKFFALWGRAISKMYAEKYAEYVRGGMSPIAASIKAATESFIEGLVGLFTGSIGDIDIGTNIQTIIGSIVNSFIEAVKDPAVMTDLLLIGGAILTAVGVGLVAAAATFQLAMAAVAWAISAAAKIGMVSGAAVGAFAGMGVSIAGTIGAAAALGLAALPALIAGAVAVAVLMIQDQIMEALGKIAVEFESPLIPTGPPVKTYEGGGMRALWPWEEGFKWPWEMAEGGVVTSPTFAMIGEAGPEAVIPLDKLGMREERRAIPTPEININISGNVYGISDIERAIEEGIDEYAMKLRLA